MAGQLRLVESAIAIVGALAVVAGGIYFVEDRFARAANLKRVDGKLEYHLLDVRFTSVRDRLWQLEKRFGANCAATRDECRRAKNELDDIERQMKRRRGK